MCEKTSILIFFLILKILILVVLPIMLFILYKRKNKIFNLFALVEILLLIIFIILRIFNNDCITNSNISGIKLNIMKNTNEVIAEDIDENDLNMINVEPNKDYRTFNNNELYYYNQNNESIKNSYYVCDGNKVYMNAFGNGFSTFATILSTLYRSNINPVYLLNNYKDGNDLCNDKITTYKLFSDIKKTYEGFEMHEIDNSQIENNIRNGNLVLVELSSNEKSNFTCDSGYIIIYNIDLNGKYMIADSSLPNNDLVCPYSSKAYGRVIKSDNMEKSWYLSEIENEAVHYYVLSIGQEMGHD